jgi:drug/metabolite transporter (DMT)-like permease
MMAQQAGLTRTSEAVNAFLTTLTVLFVPLILAIFTRRLPSSTLWIGITLALAGIWLMTGATPSGLGLGEWLGIGCSILFSVHIIAINALLSRDTPARMVGGQFVVTGVTALGVTLCVFPQARQFDVLLLPSSSGLRMDLGMLVMLATLCAFGLMIFNQPRVDPTRAALIYLTEPVFAAAFAWIVKGRSLSMIEMAGAGLIIAANSLVEWLQARRRGPESGFLHPSAAEI